MQQCLMLGSGRWAFKRKLRAASSESEENTKWTTLDIDHSVEPDVTFDLNALERGQRLPFEAGSFDEIHAYEVLTQFGAQGDAAGFFSTFRELWRVMKPGGTLIASVPAVDGPWMWGDPGITRAISPLSIKYLTKEFYKLLGSQSLTDHRTRVDPCWWKETHAEALNGSFYFALEKA